MGRRRSVTPQMRVGGRKPHIVVVTTASRPASYACSSWTAESDQPYTSIERSVLHDRANPASCLEQSSAAIALTTSKKQCPLKSSASSAARTTQALSFLFCNCSCPPVPRPPAIITQSKTTACRVTQRSHRRRRVLHTPYLSSCHRFLLSANDMLEACEVQSQQPNLTNENTSQRMFERLTTTSTFPRKPAKPKQNGIKPVFRRAVTQDSPTIVVHTTAQSTGIAGQLHTKQKS